ncbi:MAG: DUF4249 family protein [Bacteroidota bacterium]
MQQQLNTYSIYILLVLTILLSACGNLQQDIELELPEYEPEISVEAYLQAGQPYFLTLVKSQPYFDDIRVEYLSGATVTVSHSQGVDTLQEFNIDISDPTLGLLADTALLNTFSGIFGEQLVFYGSFQPVPTLYNEDFNLKVETLDGEQLTATTKILPVVPIDSLVQQFNDQQEAFVLTFFTDDETTTNFYRRVFEFQRLQVDSMDNGTVDSSFVTRVDQDFITDDIVFNGQPFAFGTDFQFEVGDTIFSTLYHITEDYFDFITTRDAAVAAALSPFGQPAVLSSNINGGKGIFTGISFVRETYVIQE